MAGASSAPLDLGAINPGFDDPIHGAQAVFRKVMDAMARPGSIQHVQATLQPPPGLGHAAGAVALTLFDFETPVWLDGALRGTLAEAWLRFHCGCPFTSDARRAVFALVTDPATAPALAAFNPGDAKYPDRSTTVILQLPALDGGAPATLAGPGIKGEARFAPRGLAPGFWEQALANHARFQLGVDVIFVAGESLAALPRSTRVTAPHLTVQGD
jgi:alpha-D-ribose 1-methylphosphonate 5-triphosphate synthase subunit PhnH